MCGIRTGEGVIRKRDENGDWLSVLGTNKCSGTELCTHTWQSVTAITN